MIVFDAGALIALARMEPGALIVRQLLRSNKGNCVIHAVNLLEIHYGFSRVNGVVFADRVLRLVDEVDVQTRADFDRDFLKEASHLKASYKLSLADTFGVALARRLDAPFISTDRHELEPLERAGICRVVFIR